MEVTPLPPPDPARVSGLLEQAITAQQQGDEKGVSRASAEIMRNANPAQYAVFMGAWEAHPEDMRKVRDTMRAANRINAEASPDQRITPPSARAAAATATSTTVEPGAAPKTGPQAASTTPVQNPGQGRTHGR
ncbi:hypothetical protein [Streptomyces sp. HUAS TT7]|uniref:hypothetical protein n=1 Tax=Streptomyces sp. HUAS TT7 TaxID=3447507 RepID=UPI003F65B8AB